MLGDSPVTGTTLRNLASQQTAPECATASKVRPWVLLPECPKCPNVWQQRDGLPRALYPSGHQKNWTFGGVMRSKGIEVQCPWYYCLSSGGEGGVALPSFAFALLQRLHAATRFDGSSLSDGAMSMGMTWSTVASGPRSGLPQ